MMAALILGFLSSGIFAGEYRWKADPVFFSAKHGRDRAVWAKIGAGFWMVTGLYWASVLVYSLVTLGVLGFDGGSCPLQTDMWKSFYHLTLWQTWLLTAVGGYIGNRPESLDALQEMKRVEALMKFELEQGNVDAFAELLNRHWELSVQLDADSTNTCIEQIFLSIEDLIDGRFIAGAGGGGFLQVILKKGVTKDMLRERLNSIFQDSGVDVWECELIF